MPILAEPYSDRWADEWDAFVAERARNGTLLHTRRFFAHNDANARDDASLLFRDRARVIGLLPAALLGADGAEAVLHSHPRSTYGGFVVAPEVGTAATLEMVDLALAYARERGARRVVVRNPFRIFHAMPSDESDYALWLRGFTVLSRELEVAVPTGSITPGDALAHFDGKTRNQVRKAQRAGVVVEASDDYAAFWPMLEENLRARHEAQPTHSLEAFARLRACVGPDAVRLVLAQHDGRVIAGAVVLVANARALHVQYIASRADALHLCPVNAVLHHLVEMAAAGGYHYLNLGMSTEDAGRRPNLGLFAFKEGFGGRGVLRETLALDLAT
ncbi:GNAT family N-acetyltransferase [Roseisolibacter agri]|uniref:BioF2-like acetyltransferase domain-containing protein n=1 Tax=Roseisolibacter agri TaxID=2014610 RepID=A0AA37QKI5_9BACT|nr:GNAT family N-acetyltransferase [Roseisolibacter agri]GLC27488.1 hypothetical protein rosag_40010 [Roseisolibacter agri]